MKRQLEFICSDAEAQAWLDVENVARALKSRREGRERDNIRELRIGGTLAVVHRHLGSGGSKEVYDVELHGKHYALALCGIVDFPQRVIEKWQTVLREPANTSSLREQGFSVNDLCQVVPTTVNDYPFPALMMKRYQDHEFAIYDSKNNSGNKNPLIKVEDELTDDRCLTLFSEMIKEIAALIRQGIGLGRDSFNLCVKKDGMHLYFNDLGPAGLFNPLTVDTSGLAREYVTYAIGAFMNSVSFDVWNKNPYVKKMDNPNSSLQEKMQEQVNSDMNYASKQRASKQ